MSNIFILGAIQNYRCFKISILLPNCADPPTHPEISVEKGLFYLYNYVVQYPYLGIITPCSSGWLIRIPPNTLWKTNSLSFPWYFPEKVPKSHKEYFLPNELLENQEVVPAKPSVTVWRGV